MQAKHTHADVTILETRVKLVRRKSASKKKITLAPFQVPAKEMGAYKKKNTELRRIV